MRIVDRKTFLTLPAGTAFQKGKPWYWEGLCFKTDDVFENDWRYLSIDSADAESSGEHWDRLEEMRVHGTSYPIDDSSSRDGSFDDQDLFLIYEPADLEWIKENIDRAIHVFRAGGAITLDADAQPAGLLAKD